VPADPAAAGRPAELTLTTGAPANGGSCVARPEGRVVFVRYALPGERVRARVTSDRGTYWHAEAVEVIEPSEYRIPSLCPIAGPDGAGCCDLAFAEPSAARHLKGEVVVNQLARLGGYECEPGLCAEPVGSGSATGWRTRVRLAIGRDGRTGFHRYRSSELVTDVNCAQLPAGMLDGVAQRQWAPGAELHVVIDDDGRRHIVQSRPKGAGGRHRARDEVIEGSHEARQRVGHRVWDVPVTGFWQAHRDAARVYSELVAGWAQLGEGMTAWDLYGGAGLFAGVFADAVGDRGGVLTVDTSRAASRAARRAFADLPQVRVVTDSVRRALAAQESRADVALLDPPRTGTGRDVIDLLAAARVPRVIQIGCEAASFARDVGLYRQRGYSVEELRVFDSFPLTHHVECVAVLTTRGR
jgi:tRNA/tmRNA/rRNA uracil-C5-methylase (TrmA/RlmC/RlmD family)